MDHSMVYNHLVSIPRRYYCWQDWIICHGSNAMIVVLRKLKSYPIAFKNSLETIAGWKPIYIWHWQAYIGGIFKYDGCGPRIDTHQCGQNDLYEFCELTWDNSWVKPDIYIWHWQAYIGGTFKYDGCGPWIDTHQCGQNDLYEFCELTWDNRWLKPDMCWLWWVFPACRYLILKFNTEICITW